MRASPLCRTASALALLAAAAGAQANYTHAINASQSNFTWSGSTSLGPIVGNPSNQFHLEGTIVLALGGGPTGVVSGSFVGGNAAVVPDIHGKIPNPFPFLPPLATVDILNLHLAASSPVFDVAANGAFTAQLTVTALSGTMNVNAPLGQTSTDLTGMASTPTAVSGALTSPGNTLHLNVPVSINFPFSDPSSGVSGNVVLNGVIVASFVCPAPATYCVTSPNSVGPGALIAASGSTEVSTNNLSLTATGCPQNVFAIFYYGTQQTSQPFGEGVRCVTGDVFRLPVVNTGPAGTAFHALDLTAPPQPEGAIVAGSTWNFQCWYRDVLGGPAGFNLSNALQIFFCP